MLELREVSKTYNAGTENETRIFDRFSLSVPDEMCIRDSFCTAPGDGSRERVIFFSIAGNPRRRKSGEGLPAKVLRPI